MTEEAKTCFEILKKAARFGVANCQLCPAYPVCPTGTAGWNNECMLETAADLIESLSEQLEQTENKLSELLYYVTGGRYSKTDYSTDDMRRFVDDYNQISRSAFDEVLDELEGLKAHAAFTEGIMVVRRELEQFPSVDAESVRHGYWMPQDNTYTKFMCSDCKGRNHDGSGKYCSECGCKMDVDVQHGKG